MLQSLVLNYVLGPALTKEGRALSSFLAPLGSKKNQKLLENISMDCFIRLERIVLLDERSKCFY